MLNNPAQLPALCFAVNYDWCVVPETNFDVIFVPGIAIILACLLQNRVQTTMVLIIGKLVCSTLVLCRYVLLEYLLHPSSHLHIPLFAHTSSHLARHFTLGLHAQSATADFEQ